MIYFPDNQDFKNCEGFNDYEKINLNGTRFYIKENSDRALIYYHGNAGSACDRSFLKNTFDNYNYTLIFVEYSGYSADNKKPSYELILKDVRNIHYYLENNSYHDNIVFGQSIGSGPASYHASLSNISKIILVSSFSSMLDLAKSKYLYYPSFFIKEKYDNIEWLKNFKGEIIIIHGEKDKEISSKLSRKLFDNLSTKSKEYVIIPNYDHNNIWFSEFIYDTIYRFINPK